ncbi:MAG: protein kinase [Planctomycetes bacterium]|nr:protein kinase [Planctomycetota bacterium]
MNERSDPPERLPLQELVGTTLGEYTIRRVLGYGSMGVVFEAHHTKLDRRVALKALPPGLGSTEKAIQRFLREAQAVAQLSHEHIVPIYEISQSGAIHWYAMRFLDGEPLDKTLQRGRLDPQEAARLMQTAARAVHFAHQHGIIHRDIKPANMIVEHGGKLVLTDFGLARPEQGSGITDSGAMVGTPRYMSPEQIRAKRGEVDRRTDIWSLGATLYEMVAGEPPFPGESTQEILQQILDVEPRTPRSLRPDLPADLEVIILKAMEKEPKRRYASALELAQDLERFLEGEPIVARRSSVVKRTVRRLAKHKSIVALTAALVMMALTFGWWTQRQRDRENDRAFKDAFEQARASFADGYFAEAEQKFAAALRIRRDDAAAHLGRARALCFLGQDWEQEDDPANLPVLVQQFGSPEALYAEAFRELETAERLQPDQPLAAFFRGFLRWRSRVAITRDQGFDDLLRAESLGVDDWPTQLELARFRFGLASGSQVDASRKGEMLQHALTPATRAVQLLGAEVARAATPLLEKWRLRAHSLRADVYLGLYESTGNLTTYLELALLDVETARRIDSRDHRSGQQLRFVNEQLEEAKRRVAEASAAAAKAAPRADSRVRPGGFAGNLLKLFDAAPMSEKSAVIAEMLKSGSEALSPIVENVGSLQEGLMDRFINPYLAAGEGVSEEKRSAAEESADAARALLQEALKTGSVTREVREQARDGLRAAIAANPRNAQYHFELAVLEQDLGELAEARGHLETAIAIAPSNPLFFSQLALVCEALQEFSAAIGHAHQAVVLAPGIVEFERLEARLREQAAAPSTGSGG